MVRAYPTPENVLVIDEPEIGYTRNIFLGSITEVTQLIQTPGAPEEAFGRTPTGFLRIGSKEIVPFSGELYAQILNIWLQYLRGDDFVNQS